MSMDRTGQPTTAIQAPKPPSLLEDGVKLAERLGRALHNLEQIHDKLNGSQPRDASAEPPEPQPSARRNVERAHALISLIEDEIQRIDSRL
jgi:hypothetical protein